MRWSIIFELSKISLLGFLLSASVNLLIARSLGASARGDLARLTLVLIMLQIFSEFGILGAVTHYSRKFQDQSADLVKKVRNFILRKMSIAVLPISVVFVFSLKWLTLFEFVLLTLSQIIVTFFQVNIYFLQGVELRVWNRTSFYQSLTYCSISLLLVWQSANVLFIVLVYNLSYVVSSLVARRKLSELAFSTRESFNEPEYLTLLNYSRKNFWWIASNQLLIRIDLLVLACYLTVSDLGLYSVALSWSMLVSPIYQSIGSIGFVEAGNLNREERQTYMYSMIKKFLIVTLVTLIPNILSGYLLVIYFLGNEFLLVPKLLPAVFCIVASKLLIQAIAQVLRGGETMGKSNFVQLAFCASLASGILISKVVNADLVMLLYVTAGVCVTYSIATLLYIRGGL